MKESIVSALAVAAISGMVFVAYNHRTAYFTILRKVAWPLIILFLLTIVVEFSGSGFLVGAAQRLNDADARKTLEAFKADMWARIGIIQLCILAIGVFGFLLTWVAQLKDRKGSS